MGCAASAPKAETFLANEQPVPKNGYMVDGVPTEGVTMQAWSNFDAGNRYHAQSGLGGALQVASMVIAQDEQGTSMDLRWATRSEMRASARRRPSQSPPRARRSRRCRCRLTCASFAKPVTHPYPVTHPLPNP